MKIIKDTVAIAELETMAQNMHGDFVKAIVDIEKRIMAVDADLHSDLFELLMREEGSKAKNLWGINLYPAKTESDFIEFDSMMNVRPTLGNKTRGVESEELRNTIVGVVDALIRR